MAQSAGLGRAEAAHGVAERLEATLAAYPGLTVTPIPAQFLRDPSPPEAGRRVLRGASLPYAGDEVFEVVADLWRHTGATVSDHTGLDGRLLLAFAPDGYLIGLTRQGPDDPILTVASPPIPQPFPGRGLLAGMLSGLTLGCAGPCLGGTIPAAAGHGFMRWAWMPLFVVVTGGCLYRPETRRFGIGLALTGTLVGVTIATVFAA